MTGKLKRLKFFYSAPGFCNERMFCYTAHDLRPARAHRDPDERITVHRVAEPTARAWVRSGKVSDAKTLVCLLAWFARDRS